MANYLMSLSLLLTFCKIMIATYLTEVLRLNKINLLQSPPMKGCVYCKVLLYITCVYIAYSYVICIVLYITKLFYNNHSRINYTVNKPSTIA